jgi:hypothetical protein
MALLPLAHVRFERASRLHTADTGKATLPARRTEACSDAEYLHLKTARFAVPVNGNRNRGVAEEGE